MKHAKPKFSQLTMHCNKDILHLMSTASVTLKFRHTLGVFTSNPNTSIQNPDSHYIFISNDQNSQVQQPMCQQDNGWDERSHCTTNTCHSATFNQLNSNNANQCCIVLATDMSTAFMDSSFNYFSYFLAAFLSCFLFSFVNILFGSMWYTKLVPVNCLVYNTHCALYCIIPSQPTKLSV